MSVHVGGRGPGHLVRTGGAFYPSATTALDFQLQQYRNEAGTYSVRDLSAVPGWSFTRASAKTALNSAGQIISFASGVPAITDLGFLVEEARTNLLLRSTDFTNAVWALGTGGAISANTIVAPDGTMTASAYTWPSAVGSFGKLSQSVAGNAAQAQSYAVWLKVPSGTKKLGLSISDVTTTTSSAPVVTVTTTWQRFTYSVAAAVLSNSGSIGVALQAGSGSTVVAGDIIHVWNEQLEANASFSTSDILTTSAAVTRARDADALALNNPAAYAVVASFIAPIGQNGFANVFQWDDGTNNNRVLVNIAQSNSHAAMAVVSGGTTVASIDLGAITPGQRYTVAVRLAAGNYGASIAGGAVLTNAYASAPPTTTTLRFGEGLSSNSPSNDLSGLIQRGIVYSSTPSDAQLQAWSAQ